MYILYKFEIISEQILNHIYLTKSHLINSRFYQKCNFNLCQSYLWGILSSAVLSLYMHALFHCHCFAIFAIKLHSIVSKLKINFQPANILQLSPRHLCHLHEWFSYSLFYAGLTARRGHRSLLGKIIKSPEENLSKS